MQRKDCFRRKGQTDTCWEEVAHVTGPARCVTKEAEGEGPGALLGFRCGGRVLESSRKACWGASDVVLGAP